MEGGNNLKDRAWALLVRDGGERLAIGRLEPLRDAEGQPAGPNDVFASDAAAREFVQLLASQGDRECLEALNMEMASVGLEELVDEPAVVGVGVDEWDREC